MEDSTVSTSNTELPREVIEELLEVALILTKSLPSKERYEQLLAVVHRVFPCDATALLRYQDGHLIPLAVKGLSPEVMGQVFDPQEHPRLGEILAAPKPVIFKVDDPRPDPFDGLMSDTSKIDVHVHSCMGCSLYVGDELLGALTLDAEEPGCFDRIDVRALSIFTALAAATIQTAGLIEALERTSARHGLLAMDLVTEALRREGGELLGESEAMDRVRHEIAVVSESDLTVLITGETGVGKELVARTIHAHSARDGEALVYINCAALPESIAESELFGHVKGAFTGAIKDRMGKFELANGATLFLDEIGELPLHMQATLLRTLQFGELQRVGSDELRSVDVRLIAATNRDLVQAIREGRFRADLYHRLSVYPIHVPALRERREDILVLGGHLLNRARRRLGLGMIQFSAEVRRLLESYNWPGNVRELDHVIIRAALRASHHSQASPLIIESEHINPEFLQAQTPSNPPSTPELRPPSDQSLSEAVEDLQRQMIIEALKASGGKWSDAAKRLKVDRSNLHRLARRLGLK